MGYTVDAIEDAVVTALQADATLAGYCREVFILPSLDQADIEKLAWRGPCVGVIGVSGDYSGDFTGVCDEAGQFAVIAMTRNLRSTTAAARGEIETEKGCWDILGDCRRVLHHHATQLGLDIHDVTATRRYLMIASAKGSAAALEITVTWRHAAT